MSQSLTPGMRTWHITFGTHGTRLHGDGRPTVDRSHNKRGDEFVFNDQDRVDRERHRLPSKAIYLNPAQRQFVESVIPDICERGKWTYRVCAAPGPPDEDHVHVLLDADRAIEGACAAQVLPEGNHVVVGRSRALSREGRPLAA